MNWRGDRVMEKACLVLSDGSVFVGTRIGAPGDCVGELVFATGFR